MRTWPALVVSGFPGLRSGKRDGGSLTDSDLFQAALTDYDVTAVEETADDSWRVFFQGETDRDRAAATLAAKFPDLRVHTVDVPDEDWAARSQAALHAVQVGNVIVAPPWDAPTVVTIQPSMGFGTGHHATTRLCLAALQRLDLRGRTVIDVGTGSGVLAIAASLRGAGNVIGIDDDPDAVQAARENLALNPNARVVLRVGDLREAQTAWADVVLANLTGGLLISAAEQLRLLTGDGGRLILSGFAGHDEADVLSAFADRAVEHRGQEDEWVCVTLR
jgi:ribosomal protein L11 methyltransferase